MRPGTNVAVLTQQPPSTPPVSTGTWCVAGITVQGPVAATPILSFQQFQQVYGPRTSSGVPTQAAVFSDSVETFFKEGGSNIVVARVVGPSAVSATIALLGAGSAASIQVTAIGPGVYANGYKVVVAGSGPYTITIEDSSSNVLEVSNSLSTVADAVAYGATSAYVTVVANGSVIPTAGTFTLASGADDLTDVVTAQYTAAIALFHKSIGPAQVSVPGVTTAAVLEAIAAHTVAVPYHVGYGDLADTLGDSSSSAASALTSAAATITAVGSSGGTRQMTLWAPWCDIAPVPGGAGTRPVPPSAFAAAKQASLDQTTGNPNVIAAGINGILSTCLDLHQTFSDTDFQTVSLAGVNLIRPMAGGFRIYGDRTVVNSQTDPLYVELSNVRLDAYILALAEAIQEEYVFAQIDGQGILTARYGNDLAQVLNTLYTNGALYGDTSADAYAVDTGSDVNTPTTESGGTITATLAYRRSPDAEQVNLNVVRVPITQVV